MRDVIRAAMNKVEKDPYCAQCIRCRIDDGLASPGEIYSDIEDFTPSPELANSLDGITGGFPCQVRATASCVLQVVEFLSQICSEILSQIQD